MSLTRFLEIRDVKAKFDFTFPKPIFNLHGKLRAPPRANRHFSLVGAAFDYLLRFTLARLNPNTITREEWVAEHALDILEGSLSERILEGIKAWELVHKRSLTKKCSEIVEQAKGNYFRYLQTGRITNRLITSCLLLAQLDPICRGSHVDLNIGSINPDAVADLTNLINIVPSKIFKAKKLCMLNPTFGIASRLIGGADADLILDNIMIDIKTTQSLELERRYYNQLIGYYILLQIGGVDDAPKKVIISYLGIYFSRYGLLYKIPVEKVVGKCDLPEFIEWFKKRVKQEFPEHNMRSRTIQAIRDETDPKRKDKLIKDLVKLVGRTLA